MNALDEPPDIRCHACRRSLQLSPGTTGVATCACREYPVVDGVLILDYQPSGNDPVGDHARLVSACRTGGPEGARQLLFGDGHRNGHGDISASHFTSFIERSLSFNRYLCNRFCHPSFAASLPLLALLESQSEGLVIEAACGIGNLSYEISKFVDPRRMIVLDQSHKLLWSLKRFITPTVKAAIAADLCTSVPLPDASVAVGFCADAFHYFPNKAAAAAEFVRVLRPDGVLVFPHLHNGLQENFAAGTPLSPREYADLFPGFEIALFPESYFAQAYRDTSPIDLAKKFSWAELEATAELTMIVSRSNRVFTEYPAIADQLYARSKRFMFNELYRREQQGESTTFHRNLESIQDMDALTALLNDFLPASERVAGEFSLEVPSAARRQLWSKSIVLDVPVHY